MFKAHEIAFEQAFDFSLEDLAALPQITYDEMPPNDRPPARYTGPTLADVLEFAGATGQDVQLTGLDGYVIDMDSSAIAEYSPILAIEADGASMGIGDYGPVQIVFPPTGSNVLLDDFGCLLPGHLFLYRRPAGPAIIPAGPLR